MAMAEIKQLLRVEPLRSSGHTALNWSLMLFFGACFLASSSGALVQPTAYEELQTNGFPAGLLPHTVVSAIHHPDGTFEVSLSERCYVDIPGAYAVSYSSKITGILSEGKLSQLSGITVKAFFVWWPITEIFVSGKDLVFVVGIASASYPASNFVDSPVCGKSMIPNRGTFSS